MDRKQLFIVDDNPAVNKKYFRKIIQRFIEKEFRFEWFAEISVDLLDKDILKLISKTNVNNIYLGIETGGKKRHQYEKLNKPGHSPLRVIKVMKSLGIPSTIGFITMMPDDTRKDLFATMKLAEKIVKIPMKNSISGTNTIFYLSVWYPYPNTLLYNRIVERGFVPPESFREWGVFYKHILHYLPKFTKNITIRDFKLVQKHFERLNLKYFMIPRSVKMLKDKISDYVH